jgi:Rho GTPase-activating protein 5
MGLSGKGKDDPEPVKNRFQALTLEQKKNLVFGVPLQEVVTDTRAPGAFEIPLLVRRCVDYVELIGLKEEGIYRISGNQTDQKELRERFDAGDFSFILHYPFLFLLLHFFLPSSLLLRV